jgi:hypothetical protein
MASRHLVRASQEAYMENIPKRMDEAQRIVEQLLNSQQYTFRGLTPSMLESVAGVYAIFDQTTGATLYVGRTKNIRRRLYTNHLMGPETNARLKKYLYKDSDRPDIPDMVAAKQYLIDNCYFQYIRVDEMVKRGQIEGLLSYLLNVTYIHEEH